MTVGVVRVVVVGVGGVGGVGYNAELYTERCNPL